MGPCQHDIQATFEAGRKNKMSCTPKCAKAMLPCWQHKLCAKATAQYYHDDIVTTMLVIRMVALRNRQPRFFLRARSYPWLQHHHKDVHISTKELVSDLLPQ